MSEVIFTDEESFCGMEGKEGRYRYWYPDDAWVLVIRGEVVEEDEQTAVLERGQMAVPPAQGGDSGTQNGAGTGPAGNSGLPL